MNKNNSREEFVSSIIELKLDQTLIFAWQNYSHDQKEIPPYTTVLEFLDKRARATCRKDHSKKWSITASNNS